MSNQTRIWTAARSEPSIPAAGPSIPWHATVQDSQHSTGVLAQHGTGQPAWHSMAQDSTGHPEQHRRARTAQESQESTGEPGEHRTEELAQHRRAASEAQPQRAGRGFGHVWFVQLSSKTTQAIPSQETHLAALVSDRWMGCPCCPHQAS